MSEETNSQEQRSSGNKRKERTFKENTFRYHNYFKRTGRYRFVGKNLLRLFGIIAAFGLGAWIVTEYIIDLDTVMEFIFQNLPHWVIVLTLFLSESVIGVLPPDLYIFWAKTLPEPYLMVFILSMASYLGGCLSYWVGRFLNKVPRIRKWVHVKFEEQFKTFRKYGGLFIFISALTPLPFAWVSVVSGVVRYPFWMYLLMALSRIIRFFGYAYVFYLIV